MHDLSFITYLLNRTQSTKYANTYVYSLKPITIGVPQGLGPLLFVLYVNDLYHMKNIYNVKLKMYADGTVIFTSPLFKTA